MTTPDHHDRLDSFAPGDAKAWTDVAATLRDLPRHRADVDVETILASTVDRHVPDPECTPSPVMGGIGHRRRAIIAAAAALLALASAIAWWTAPHSASKAPDDFSEFELAQIEADLERALVHAGRVLNHAERITLEMATP